MRLNFAGKTKGKLHYIPQVLKKGQKDTVPAATIRIKATVSNRVLDLLDKTIRPILFCKGTGGPAKQATIENVEPLSDLLGLTEPGMKLGTLHWNDKQTGCKLTVHQGATGDMNVVLRDGTVDKVQWTGKEGGGVDLQFNFYVSDIDTDTIGMLGALHKQTVEFELELPELLQKQIDDGEDIAPQGNQITPLQALKSGKDTRKAA